MLVELNFKKRGEKGGGGGKKEKEKEKKRRGGKGERINKESINKRVSISVAFTTI